MLRGDIRLVNFGPGLVGEPAQRRPAVIVSNDGANAVAARLGRGALTVAPMTSNITRVYPFQVLVPAESSGLDMDSKAQAEQVRTVSVARIGDRVGQIPAPLMLAIDDALRLHLAL
ncbi:MAG: type II toxin-antitoxin system PemK/MazF family toxin [Actinomycetia bacterium]|nr:type II toxin-antitoxin system PemK/MazF family toxin [Actinomycetes bacterium]